MTFIKKAFFASTLCILFISFNALQADTVTLKNGGAVVGKIVSQSRKNIRIRKQNGQIVTIPKTNVRRVIFGKVPEKKPEEKKPEEKPPEEKKPETNIPENNTSSAGPSRWDVMWRAAVLPGWGHYHAGKSAYGFGIGGAFFASAGFTGYAVSNASTLEAEYNDSTLTNFILTNQFAADGTSAVLGNILLNSDPYSQFQSATDTANAAALVTGIIYLAQLSHAYFMDLGPATSLRESEGWQWDLGLAPAYASSPASNYDSSQAFQIQANFQMVWRY